VIPPGPRRGGVWVADLNPRRRGTEPGKIRPVVVVQTDALNPHHTSTLVCPLTAQIGRPENLLRVRLNKGEGGVARDSDVMLDQLRALDNGRFLRRMGQVLPEKMEELRNKLVSLMDLAS
jgi:mRNA interferase MazF